MTEHTEPTQRPRRGLRLEQTDAVRARLLASALAVIEAGAEPTMRAVAEHAGVAERTVYRYFASRDVLYEAMVPSFSTRASAPLPATAAGLVGYVRDLYETFERNAALIEALVRGPWAAPFLAHSRPANLAAVRALLDQAYPCVGDDERAAAATSIRLVLSGSSWSYLRDCQLDIESAVTHGQWIVGRALRSLAAQGGDDAHR